MKVYVISFFLVVGVSHGALLGKNGILSSTANKIGLGNIINVNADAEANLLGNKVGVDGAVGIGGNGIGAHLAGDANVLGQKLNVHGDVLEGHAIDQQNHQVFRDNRGRQYILQRQYIGSNSVLVRKYLDNGQIYVDGADQNNILQHSQNGNIVLNGNSGSNGVLIIGGNQGQQGGFLVNGGSGLPTTNIELDPGFAGPWRNLLNIKKVSPLNWQEWLVEQKQKNKNIDITIIENWINQQHQLLKVDIGIIEGWIIQQQNLNPSFLYNWIIKKQVPNILGSVTQPIINPGWSLNGEFDLPGGQLHYPNNGIVLNGNSGSNGIIIIGRNQGQQGGLIVNGGSGLPNTNVVQWGNLLNIKRVSPLNWQEWLLEQKQKNKYIDLTIIENWINQQHQILNLDIGIIEGWIIQQQDLNPSFLYNWIIKKQVPNISNGKGPIVEPTWNVVTPQVWQQWVIQQTLKNNLDLTVIENWIYQQHKTLNLDVGYLEGWIIQQQRLNPNFLYNWIIKKQVPHILNGKIPIVDPTWNVNVEKVTPEVWQQWVIQQTLKNNLDLTVIENWIYQQHKIINLDVGYLEGWIIQQQRLNPNFLYNWIIKKQVPNISNGKEPIVDPTWNLNVEKVTPEVWQQWVIQQTLKNNLDLTVIENWIYQQHKTLNLDVGYLEGWIIQQQRLNPSFLYNWIIKKQVPNISDIWNGKEPLVEPTWNVKDEKVAPEVWQQWLIYQKQKNNIDITVIENWINKQHQILKLDFGILEAWIINQQSLNPSFLYNWIIRKQVPNVSDIWNGKEPLVEPTWNVKDEKVAPEVWQQWLIYQKQKNNIDITVIENWINKQHQILKLDFGTLEAWIINQQSLNPSFLYNWIIRKQVPNISDIWNGKEPLVEPTWNVKDEKVAPEVWQQWLIYQKQKNNIDITVIENWINKQHQILKLDFGTLEAWIINQQSLNPSFLYNWIIRKQVPNVSDIWNGKEPLVEPTWNVKDEKVAPEVWQQWLIYQKQKNNIDITVIENWINKQHQILKLDVGILEAWIINQQSLNPSFLYNWIIRKQVPNISDIWNEKEPTWNVKDEKVTPEVWQQWLIYQKQKNNIDITVIENWINKQHQILKLDFGILEAWIINQQSSNPSFLYNWIIKKQVPNISDIWNGKESLVEPTWNVKDEKVTPEVWQQWLIYQKQKNNIDITVIVNWINKQHQILKLDVGILEAWIINQQSLNPSFLYNWIIKKQVPNISDIWNGKEPLVEPTWNVKDEKVTPDVWQQWLIYQKQKYNIDITVIENWINVQHQVLNIDVGLLKGWIINQQSSNPSLLYNWIIRKQVPEISSQWIVQHKGSQVEEHEVSHLWINGQIVESVAPGVWQKWIIEQKEKYNIDISVVENWINQQHQQLKLEVGFLEGWIIQQQKANTNFLYNWVVKKEVPSFSYQWKVETVVSQEQQDAGTFRVWINDKSVEKVAPEVWQKWITEQQEYNGINVSLLEKYINQWHEALKVDVAYLEAWVIQEQQADSKFLYRLTVEGKIPAISYKWKIERQTVKPVITSSSSHSYTWKEEKQTQQ
ncbi:uncharacterized protein [Diabrotica undecimpunctata]|uniref:uncharacterized protein n=1 Tax=Diabrotica undecimpunctata TaxID=50387 RepID=UPI003B63E033